MVILWCSKRDHHVHDVVLIIAIPEAGVPGGDVDDYFVVDVVVVVVVDVEMKQFVGCCYYYYCYYCCDE